MAGRFQILAIVPLLVTLTALVLSFLCLFSGNRPGFMDSFAIMTVNTSRVGMNAVETIDNRILGVNVSNIIEKRSEPVASPVMIAVTQTPAPTAFVQVRQIGGLLSDISAEAGSLRSKAGSVYTSAASAVESKATAAAGAVESQANSLENFVASKIQSAVASLQTAAVELVDDVYYDMLSGLNLTDFYAINLRTTCQGHYVSSNGTNITTALGAYPPNGTRKSIDECATHSSLNPLVLIRVLFIVGIAFTCLAALLCIWGIVRFSRLTAMLNILASMPALGFMAVATAITHGVAVGASAFLNFFGEVVGIKVTYGGPFFALAWAATILLFLDFALWTLLLLFADKLPGRRGDRDLAMDEKSRGGL